jgi:hypothetical protein
MRSESVTEKGQRVEPQLARVAVHARELPLPVHRAIGNDGRALQFRVAEKSGRLPVHQLSQYASRTASGEGGRDGCPFHAPTADTRDHCGACASAADAGPATAAIPAAITKAATASAIVASRIAWTEIGSVRIPWH